MKIHGFFYLVVGTGIAIISKIANSSKFVLFMYAGIVFALVGILKIFLENRKKEKPAVAPAYRMQQQQQIQRLQDQQRPIPNQNHYITRHHRVTRNHRMFMQYCRVCGNELRAYDNFCSRCGQRIYR